MVYRPSLRRRACLAGLLLVVTGGALWAQQDVGELLRQYEQRKITILPEEAQPDLLWWGAMEGFESIHESELLKLAGYEEEARAAGKHRTLRIAANVGTLGLALGGLLFVLDATLVPMIVYPGSGRINMTEMGVGAGVTIAALAAWGIFVIRIPPNTIPHGRIIQITRDYNDALIDTINQELRDAAE